MKSGWLRLPYRLYQMIHDYDYRPPLIDIGNETNECPEILLPCRLTHDERLLIHYCTSRFYFYMEDVDAAVSYLAAIPKKYLQLITKISVRLNSDDVYKSIEYLGPRPQLDMEHHINNLTIEAENLVFKCLEDWDVCIEADVVRIDRRGLRKRLETALDGSDGEDDEFLSSSSNLELEDALEELQEEEDWDHWLFRSTQ